MGDSYLSTKYGIIIPLRDPAEILLPTMTELSKYNRYEILLLYAEAENGYVTQLVYRGVEIRYYCKLKNTHLVHMLSNEH